MIAPSRRHTEGHRTERIGWLRAAVLGANDGIVSTASLVVGVAAASASHASILTTGVALRLGPTMRPVLQEIKRNLRTRRYAPNAD